MNKTIFKQMGGTYINMNRCWLSLINTMGLIVCHVCGHVYCEVKPYTTLLAEIRTINPMGIILTGGPNSVYLENAFIITLDFITADCP